MTHKPGSRALVRTMVRRIRIMREMRTNTYNACRVLRQVYYNRHAQAS